MKPSFANNGILVYSVPGSTRQVDGPLKPTLRPLVSGHKEVRFARFAPGDDLNTVTLTSQKNATHVDARAGFPHAQTDSAQIFLGEYAGLATSDAEHGVWALAGILFDPIHFISKDLVAGMMDEQIAAFEPQLRKDALGAFWAQMMAGSVNEKLTAARSPEEKALLLLTANRAADAAEVLAQAKNFRLAALVAQLPGNERSRDLVRSQIETWRQRNDWSEMSDAVRTLYSILAGEACTVAGKNGPKEDRISEVNIAEHFGLSWRQSFALRVLYDGHSTLSDAVQAYVKDITSGRERVLPLPRWVQDGKEAEGGGREDILLGLLRLFSTTRAHPADLEAIFDAKTVSGSSANSRLAWQLVTILSAKGWADYLSAEKVDQLTRDFAAELESDDKFVTAAWVLLHLTHPRAREAAVTELMMRNGGKISDPHLPDHIVNVHGANTFGYLADDNQIPEGILWRSKALHARSELGSAFLQAKYLLAAKEDDEAHDVLCTIIGPQAVIAEDYGPLIEIVQRFSGLHLSGWETGGGVFEDFVRLVTLSVATKRSPDGAVLMQRLRSGLERLRTAKYTSLTLEEKVALVEMKRVLEEEVREADGISAEDAEATRIASLRMGESLWGRYKDHLGIVA